MTEQLFQALLPSGRAVRWIEVTTEALINAQMRALEKVEGNTARLVIQTQIELVTGCLHAYTEPVQFVFAPAEEGAEEQPPKVDVDATLAGIGPGQWVKTSYLDLASKGEKNLLKVFSSILDWNKLMGLVGQSAAPGSSPFPSTAKKVFVER